MQYNRIPGRLAGFKAIYSGTANAQYAATRAVAQLKWALDFYSGDNASQLLL